jgi:hypothetical protein
VLISPGCAPVRSMPEPNRTQAPAWLSDASRDGFQATIERFAEDSWTFMKEAFEASNLSCRSWTGKRPW